MATPSRRKRLAQFERQLAIGKQPALRKPIPGVPYDVLVQKAREHGLEVGVDLFIPLTGGDAEREFRYRWRQRRAYLRSSLAHHATWRAELRKFFLTGYNDSEQEQLKHVIRLSQFGT